MKLASDVAKRIQSTLIPNNMTATRLDAHLAECLRYDFHAAMIPPAWVSKTAKALNGSGVRVASFIDLPYGTMTSTGKAYESAQLVQLGVEEIDLMPNVGFLLFGDGSRVFCRHRRSGKSRRQSAGQNHA